MTTFTQQLTLSPQQEILLDCVRNESCSINLVSRAGTGKTTSLMEVAKVIKESAFLGAFNKAIADEFKERLASQGSSHVTGATIHSAGMSACRRVNPKIVIDGRKVQGIAKKKFGWDRKMIAAVDEAVGYGKQVCLGVEGCGAIEDTTAWQELIDRYDVQDDIPPVCSVETFIGHCIEVYKKSLDQCEEIADFNDMLLAPLYFKAPFRKYKWVMIDECQDTNKARRLIAYAMMDKGSRFLAVGDPAQSIYGWCGADSDAMDIIKGDLGSKELYLSVTYRCPRAVVKLANTWVPDLKAAPTAPQGLVTNMTHSEFFQQRFNINDVILCRNTRPLVGVAGRLRDMGTSCIVEGMSGKGLTTLATKWGDDITIDSFLEYLDQHQTKETAKWTLKGNEAKVEWVQDKCGTLTDLSGRLRPGATVKDLVRQIDFLFGDNGGHVLRLCTIHKSKGREWNRVYLVGRNRYQPSPYATSDWAMKQEENLAYVAVTRAKVELVEVEVPFKKRGEGQEWWEN